MRSGVVAFLRGHVVAGYVIRKADSKITAGKIATGVPCMQPMSRISEIKEYE